MSDRNKEMIDWFNAELSKLGHENFQWTNPEDMTRHFQIPSNVTGLSVDTPGWKAVTIETAVERDEAMPIRPIKGNVAAIEKGDTVRASGTVTFQPPKGAGSPIYTYSSGKNRKRITMPPGYMMERVLRWVFFFSRKTPRIFNEVVADYRHEMIEAEASGRTSDLLRLRIQHWGGFIKSLIIELAAGNLGKIIKALTGG